MKKMLLALAAVLFSFSLFAQSKIVETEWNYSLVDMPELNGAEGTQEALFLKTREWIENSSFFIQDSYEVQEDSGQAAFSGWLIDSSFSGYWRKPYYGVDKARYLFKIETKEKRIRIGLRLKEVCVTGATVFAVGEPVWSAPQAKDVKKVKTDRLLSRMNESLKNFIAQDKNQASDW